ncbi:hypothetical protein [uncultured Algibacter sp.]|uniref:hypothetical protein n=1 Tax=uncultured Algibacter sp. TaxID=298659 RepID=UPI00321685E5
MVDGKFKNPKTTTKDTYGDLICLQLDKKSNILERTTIKNPLFKTIEFIDDSKSFHTKHIDLDSTNFSVRLQLKQNAQYISLIEVNLNNTSVSKPLITTKLN